MKSVQICFLFILVPIVKGHFNIIQCYACDDCDVFDDCLLQSCPQIKTSTAASTTSTQTSLAPGDPPSAIPTSPPMPTSSTKPTFLPPTPTTSSTFTTTNATTSIPTTSKKTTSITFTTTHATTSIPTTSKKTTLPPTPADTTWTNTESVTQSTEILETDGITTAEDATTTEMSSSTTSETTEQTTDESTELTESTEPATENVANGLETAYSYKSVLLGWPVVSYHCYSIDIVENYKKKKRRGCVKVPVNKSGCTVLKEKFGCSAENCKLCSFDRCNSCRALKYSMLALITCIVFGFIFK